MALIHKIEALSDWLQVPGRNTRLNMVLGIFLAIAILWGMFFVPRTILLDHPNNRIWVDIATITFPWLSQIEVHWGTVGQKALYLQSVFYLLMEIPVTLYLLAGWLEIQDTR